MSREQISIYFPSVHPTVKGNGIIVIFFTIEVGKICYASYACLFKVQCFEFIDI